jgi:hypothetical protein
MASCFTQRGANESLREFHVNGHDAKTPRIMKQLHALWERSPGRDELPVNLLGNRGQETAPTVIFSKLIYACQIGNSKKKVVSTLGLE